MNPITQLREARMKAFDEQFRDEKYPIAINQWVKVSELKSFIAESESLLIEEVKKSCCTSCKKVIELEYENIPNPKKPL